MAQTTTNYGLLKPESTDSYNHLIYDNPNMDTIDAAMKANADAAITSATCIKSGTTHTITRSNTNASVMRFTATGDWNTGDTMIIDGVTVTPYLMTGEALKTGAFLINSEVIVSLSGTRATVLSNQSEAGTTYFDDSNVLYTANNVQDAIESASTATGTEYANGVSVKQVIDNINDWTYLGNLLSNLGDFNVSTYKEVCIIPKLEGWAAQNPVTIPIIAPNEISYAIYVSSSYSISFRINISAANVLSITNETLTGWTSAVYSVYVK